MAAVGISVVMASKNGTDTLKPVFQALSECILPACGVEFLLVDNNSSDKTLDLMSTFADGKTARVLTEQRPGKSFALNTAIEVAKGELLVFIDDDALPTPDWLEVYWAAYNEHQSDGVFIGQVRPKFLAPAPLWLEQLTDSGRSFACTPIRQKAGNCSPRLAKGLNWAIRRSALSGELFDEQRTNLLEGRKPVGGQDTEMARRLERKGVGIRFVPQATALHQVLPHELTLKAIFDRYRRIGRGTAAQRTHNVVENAMLPLTIPIFAAIAAFCWAIGAKYIAGAFFTRVASAVGRVDYFLGGLFGRRRSPSPLGKK